jgi:AcrR family transcriptional regulator
VPRDGAPTRRIIIDTAERLLAERGVDGVSLREINVAAGQRNSSALQYHFGDRAGLLRAIADRHLPIVDARRQELFEELAGRSGMTDTERYVEVATRPMAEYMTVGPGARAWAVIASELAAHPSTEVESVSAAAAPALMATALPVFERLESLAGRAFAIHRMRSASEAALHLIADRARAEMAPRPARSLLALPEFIDDVIRMATAAIDAPPPADHTSTSVGGRGGRRETRP